MFSQASMLYTVMKNGKATGPDDLPIDRVVTWYMGSGLKAQNMTGIRAQRKGLRDQKNGIRDHDAFEPESGIRFITRSKNLITM